MRSRGSCNGIKTAGRNINNLRYADDMTLMAESEEEPKSLLMKLKEESEKLGLKLNIKKTKIMASGPITSWQIDGETVETVSDFIFGEDSQESSPTPQFKSINSSALSLLHSPTRKTLQMVIAAMKLKDAYSLEGKL